MANERAKALYFTGSYDANGQPLEYFAAVPARDLDESDIGGLRDETYQDITGAPTGRKPLYQKTRPSNAADVPESVQASVTSAKDGGGPKDDKA